MKNKPLSKSNDIAELLRTYSKKYLDQEYMRLFNNVFNDLLECDKDVFKHGKESTWAASIIWAVGSVNFIGDKSFEPHASLSDVCGYFNANTSTVGQKASRIRYWLDIDRFNNDYLREDSPISELLNNLVITEDGLIISSEWLKEEVEEEALYENIEDEEELPDHYIIIIDAKSHTKQADLYQLEYLFKTLLDEDEQFEKIEIIESMKIHLTFYGRSAKVLSFEKKLNSYRYEVSDIIKKP